MIAGFDFIRRWFIAWRKTFNRVGNSATGER
jgi:hypothetical protein